MDANGPLAENDRKLNFHAKEVNNWTALHFVLSSTSLATLRRGESKPALPSASLTSQCVSIVRFSLPPPPYPTITAMLSPSCLAPHVIGSSTQGLHEGLEIS